MNLCNSENLKACQYAYYGSIREDLLMPSPCLICPIAMLNWSQTMSIKLLLFG